jgi:hypothetical protein
MHHDLLILWRTSLRTFFRDSIFQADSPPANAQDLNESTLLFLRAIALPLRNISVNAWNLATYWSSPAANKQFRPVLGPENFPNLLPFFTENSPYSFAGVFTLHSRPQPFLCSFACSSFAFDDSAILRISRRRNSENSFSGLSPRFIEPRLHKYSGSRYGRGMPCRFLMSRTLLQNAGNEWGKRVQPGRALASVYE